jgi:anaerobic selenocysteine-containing dehydrogenase
MTTVAIKKTLCNRDCPDACAIVATVEDGRVTSLAGDPDHPITRGFLCYRTGHFLLQQYGPDRLTQPLLRKGGELAPVGWDEALDFVAERLLAIKAESGPAAIFHYRSGGSLGLLKHLCDHFWDRFGPVTIKRGDICSGAGDEAQMLDFGEEDSHDLHDLLNSRHILLWGKNVFVSSPHTIPVLRQAREKGAQVVLVDPVHHKTATICDAFHQPRPGGDFALAMAIARILFDEGRTDPRASEYCDHVDELGALARTRTVEEWCREADVAPPVAVELAGRLAGGPCAILVGWGMGRRGNGGAIIRALDALAAISGNLGVPGGGVSYYFKRRAAFDTSWIGGIAAAPRTIAEPMFGPELLRLDDPPVRAVWITAGNPVCMLPESETIARALSSRELVVVVDPFMTDTARLAHVVLPSATLLEDDDLVGAYGHHYIGEVRPVVPPPRGVKTDLEILQALAPRLGLIGVVDGTAREWKARLLRPEVGILDDLPMRNPRAPQVLFADRRFPTKSGRVNLLTTAPPPALDPGGDFPLVLLGLATERSQSSQWPKAPDGPAVCTVHPDAAAGIPDGALARLETRVSSLVVRLKHDVRQRRDVAIVPKGGHLRAGRCPNVLLSARTTDIGEGGALNDETCRIVPA